MFSEAWCAFGASEPREMVVVLPSGPLKFV